MLYKIERSGDVFEKIEPVEFKDFSSFGKLEKDLENLIAKNILDILFEEAKLMPIFQERQWQSEADIYALNEKGDLVIFELKRATAGHDAVQQALRYAQVNHG
jgi:RecB family endonuclease NucS